MTDTKQGTAPHGVEADQPSSWLEADVDGRPVKFWIVVASAIAVVTLGFGALWVWGLDRGMQMAGDTAGVNGQMADVPATDVVVNMPLLTWPEGSR